MSLETLLQPRVVELGKIKLGGLGEERTAKSGEKYRQPVKYDHFRIVTLYRGDDGKLVEDDSLMDALKDYADKDGKLRRLPISFLSNDLAEILQTQFLWYAGKSLGGRSDGETLTWFNDPKTNKRLADPLTEPWTPEHEKDKRWKKHTTLNCVIAAPQARWGGVYKLRTTSVITGDQLYGSLLLLASLTGGILRGLPVRLVVRPMKVAPEGKPTTIYVAHVEMIGNDLAQIQALVLERAKFELSNVRQLAQVQREYRQLLAHPVPLDEEEEAEIADEFHPPADPAVPAPAPPTPEETEKAIEEAARGMLAGATTLDHIRAEWDGLPPALQKKLTAFRDELKAKLAAPPPADEPPLHPAFSEAAFDKLAAQKGKKWNECVTSVNARFGTDYPPVVAFGDVTPDARRHLVKELEAMPDAPAGA